MPLSVDVALPLAVDAVFTYSVPEELSDGALVGMRAVVPFRRNLLTGMIVAVHENGAEPAQRVLRPVADFPDPSPSLDPTMLSLTRWIADYYLSSWGEAIRAAIPHGLGTNSVWMVHLSCENPHVVADNLQARFPKRAEILRCVAEKGQVSLKTLARVFSGTGFRSNLQALQNDGHVKVRDEAEPIVLSRVRTEKLVQLAPAYLDPDATRRMRFGAEQLRVIDGLRTISEPLSVASVRSRFGVSTATVNRLVARGVLNVEEHEVDREPDYGECEDETGQLLTNDQRDALGVILPNVASRKFSAVLLHGVTGSGKTRVYLDAIEHTLDAGRGAIVLVPEISLTPQTVRRFRSRFRENVAVLHSQLTAGERLDAWRALHEGRKKVAVGPRSAVFAPVRDVGLIVVDEEHDGSYKQEDSDPRYHARDVAVMRARMSDSVVLLGSATPSLESLQNVRRGKYTYVRLPGRVDDKPLPEVQIVDMRKERTDGNWGGLSRSLRSAVARTIETGNQAVILQNRRGFSTVLQCSRCGRIVECQNCQVSMTYHRPEDAMKCHYCGDVRPVPRMCPECNETSLRFSGTGTQKVEDEISKAFPNAILLRMDQDTTHGRNAHHRLLERFRKNEASILLGTQMVAKGLDFPNVTLVGVISADIGLGLPDFRAAERTFQLLTQVAGRTGRGNEPGHVIVQTAMPEDPAIQAASRHDVDGFAEDELRRREELGYPPFGKLVLIQLRGSENDVVRQAARTLAVRANDLAEGKVEVLGPSEAPIPRINKQWRWHILLKGTSSQSLRAIAKGVQESFRRMHSRFVQLSINVDPISLI